ncbi:hypothetical protein RHGRI_026212 [Rhododendron griersonianum]|uniref:Secreted protein n=1 Tax=Rhododendron griersonianum TaxID=479676 RepID=A0AAV6IRW1_9ERIC|nr:hypothetical protein RHGRI_026212 [Rhododendron griersonianum]
MRSAMVVGCVGGASWGVSSSGSCGAVIGGVSVATRIQSVRICPGSGLDLFGFNDSIRQRKRAILQGLWVNQPVGVYSGRRELFSSLVVS